MLNDETFHVIHQVDDALQRLRQSGFEDPDRTQANRVEHPEHINRGASAARNLGIRHARGEFIAFIDADDVWESSKLAEQISLMEGMPEVGMICGALLHWYSWNPAATDADYAVLTGGVADRRGYRARDRALDPCGAGRGAARCRVGCGALIQVRARGGGYQSAPPVIWMFSIVIPLASSRHRKAARAATSSG